MLPVAEPWPVSDDGRPMEHMATIDLSEIPRIENNPLPTRGALLFFYDAEEQPWGIPGQKKGWRILYRSPDDIGRPETTVGLPEAPVGMAFSPTLSYSDDLDLDLTEEEIDLYYEWLHGGGPPFQLFGHESAIQSALSGYVPGHRLLLQIPSDETLGYGWGDMGCLYFTMTPEDMEAGRFENAWLTLQCY